MRQHHRSPFDDEADMADERLIQDRVHGHTVVGHALGLARRRGAWCLGIQVGHRPIVSVFAYLADLVCVPQLDRGANGACVAVLEVAGGGASPRQSAIDSLKET